MSALRPFHLAWTAALGFACLALALPATAQNGGLKVAVIDVQRLVSDSDAGKALVGELQAFGQQREAELNTLREEVQAIEQRIKDGQLSLSEDRLTDLRTQYERKVTDLRRAAEDANRELRKKEADSLGAIEKRVMPILQQVGSEGGYTMIFRKFESGLVYASDSIDITAEVVQRLNAADAAAATQGQ